MAKPQTQTSVTLTNFVPTAKGLAMTVGNLSILFFDPFGPNEKRVGNDVMLLRGKLPQVHASMTRADADQLSKAIVASQKIDTIVAIHEAIHNRIGEKFRIIFPIPNDKKLITCLQPGDSKRGSPLNIITEPVGDWFKSDNCFLVRFEPLTKTKPSKPPPLPPIPPRTRGRS